MLDSIGGALAICLAWGAFGLIHSLPCRSWAKRDAERALGPAFLAGLYRPLYALLSTAALLWLWIFPSGLNGDIRLFALPGALRFLPLMVKTGAVILIAACFRQISFWEFTGVGQLARRLRGELREIPPTPPGALPLAHGREPLAAAGVYLWVRHPLNTAAFVWIWAQGIYTLYNLTFAACLTAYILIANRWEERDLISRYGPAYERYREIVPAFSSGVSALGARAEMLRRSD